MGDKHPLIEFTQGFLDSYEGVDYTRPEDREEVARDELDRKFGQGNDQVNQDVEPAGLGGGGREIPDPPSLDDIDVDVGPGRGQGEQVRDDTGGTGVDMNFRPKDGVSRADFETMYERDIINVNGRDQWVRWLDRHEYLDRSELRSHRSEDRMYKFVYEKCKEILDGEIMADIRRRPISYYESGSEIDGSSGGQGFDYGELSSEELLSLLGQMVEEGKVSKMEAESLLMKVKESKGSGGLASTEDSYGEMTGKFPDQGGESSDPEVEKLDEMLNRFRD
ncbi:hypothetical protein KY092_07855 [Natronomonas gomsonensis]|uniref:hypothetical protein n=1 Tax=Natronomonas gomsonensis TaxID=1046043 RepID=UPI0020CA5FFF|nr:hypothetical protein [Natronomonas gomsonensis]MCY4730470.1 hypothetical protein [Natronomonas gomsonensis]